MPPVPSSHDRRRAQPRHPRWRAVTQASLCLLALSGHCQAADPTALAREIDAYLAPYIETANFQGSVLIASGDKILFASGYGEAVVEHSVPNTPDTVFHIASASKPFTAAAVLWLAERKQVDLGARLITYLPDYPPAGRLTLHHLLSHTSGIPNINEFEEYATLQRVPQTPESLFAVLRDRPLAFEPGERYDYSNSNYNLLALVVERAAGQPFGDFLRQHVLAPAGADDSAHHADAGSIIARRAEGYSPVGVFDLERAEPIDWSVKVGNGSMVSTVVDLFRWVRAFFADRIVSATSRGAMLTEHTPNVGYGWFITERHGRRQYHINGRSPGYSSYVGYYPEDELTVVVLTNIYNSITTTVGSDLAAIAFDESYVVPSLNVQPMSAERARGIPGTFQFGPDFYNSNAVAELVVRNGYVHILWGDSHFESALIPNGTGPANEERYIDRMFWSQVAILRDAEDRASELHFEQFRARRLPR